MITKISKIKNKVNSDIQKILTLLEPYEVTEDTLSNMKNHYERLYIDEELGYILRSYVIYKGNGIVEFDDDIKEHVTEEVQLIEQMMKFDFIKLLELVEGEEIWELDISNNCHFTYFEVDDFNGYSEWFIYGKVDGHNILCRLDNESREEEIYNQLEELYNQPMD
ncbi:hypothetical protein [Brassicibacter mesophilus]|uniref:hypothetical protein n=1 Tax=Brassicibacter mesophilus TaxID=745119 RepID=UPI003D1BC0B3